MEHFRKNFNKLHRLSILTKKLGAPTSLSHVLGLDLERLTDKNILENKSLTIQNKVLTYQYKLPPTTATQNRKFFPLSVFLAVIDEYTTWDLMLNDRKSRFGVSASLECEVGPEFYNSSDTVQLRARVEKIGKSLGFVSAQVINIRTGKVICYGRHMKYMSTPLDYVLDEPFYSIANFFLPFFAKNRLDGEQFIPTLGDVFNDKDIENLGMSNGRITLGKWQTNGIGGLHGGSQAIAMERVGYEYMKNSFKTDSEDIILQSMTISFMSATKITSILFYIDVMNQDNTLATIKVQLKSDDGSTTISEGILRYNRKSYNDI